MSKPEIIIVHETPAQSWKRDASSFALFLAIIGVGVALNSAAMQWVGAIIAFLTLIGSAIHMRDKCKMSIAEARKRLDEIEGQQ